MPLIQQELKTEKDLSIATHVCGAEAARLKPL